MPQRSRKRTVLNAALAVAAFALLLKSGWLRPITDPLTRATFAAAAPVYRAGAMLARIRDAAAGREPAPDELDRLRAENARLHALVAENEALKDAVEYRDRESAPALAARVVSRTSGDLFHGLVIDRGSEDGVRVGQAAVTGDGVIVGKVARVGATSAAVMLLTDSQSRLAVSLQDSVGTLGVLAGDRGASASVDLIPARQDVAPGDAVVTSGLEPGIRRGLVVGVIEKVQREAQDPFQTALITPPGEAANPLFVQILLTPVTE
jgi:rod shape-determining protein MreC